MYTLGIYHPGYKAPGSLFLRLFPGAKRLSGASFLRLFPGVKRFSGAS